MGTFLKFIGGAVLLFLGFVTIMSMVSPLPRSATGGAAAPQRTTVMPPLPRHKMAITDITWKRSAGGSLAEMTLKISNDNDYPVKDMEIACQFSGPSGTVIKRKSAHIYEVIAAGKSRTFRRIEFGFIDKQVNGAVCDLADARRA